MRKKRRHYTYVSEEEIREAFEDWKKETSSSTLDQELEEANRWAAMHGIKTPPFPRKRRRLRRVLPVRQETEDRPSHRRFRPVVQLASVMIILVMGGWYAQTDPVRGARVGIMDLLVGQHRDKYIFQMEHSSQNEDWRELRPAYIPEGFELVDQQENNSNLVLRYNNGSYFIYLMISVDNQYMIYKEESEYLNDHILLSNGNIVNIYRQEGTVYFDWIIQNAYVSLVGNISEVEMINIAESI